MKRIVFWFDPVSPYAYLAFERLPEALAGCSYEVEYRPVLFGAMLQRWGTVGPAEVEVKRAWTFRHVHWLAAQAGLAMQTPAVHPFNPIALSRLALAAAGPEDGALPNRRTVERVLRHVWQGGGADATDPARLAALAAELAPARDPAGDSVKAQLRELTEDALERGVFGVPSYGIDGRVLWGLDALPMLRAELNGEGALPHEAWTREGAPRPGVRRKD